MSPVLSGVSICHYKNVFVLSIVIISKVVISQVIKSIFIVPEFEQSYALLVWSKKLILPKYCLQQKRHSNISLLLFYIIINKLVCFLLLIKLIGVDPY